MAEIADPRLTIEAVAGQDHRWTVSVSYTIRFPNWEAGSWISEVVEVRGGTPESDAGGPPLLRLRHPPWKLVPIEGAEKDGEHHLIERRTEPQTIGTDVLDENPDERVLVIERTRVDAEALPGDTTRALFLTAVRRAALIREDRVYARVELQPCLPRACSGNSNVVTSQFGEDA